MLKAQLVGLSLLATFSGMSMADTRIHFDHQSDTISSAYFETINEISKSVMLDDNAVINLLGCTSIEGTPEFNMALAEQRVQAVKRYFVNNGIYDEKINMLAYGEECSFNYAPSAGKDFVKITIINGIEDLEYHLF